MVTAGTAGITNNTNTKDVTVQGDYITPCLKTNATACSGVFNMQTVDKTSGFIYSSITIPTAC